MPALRAAVRLFLLFATGFIGVILQRIVLFFSRGDAAFVIPHYWHKFVCAVTGIKIEVEGQPIRDRQVLYIANHLSYLDISVMTATAPASFVSRADVSSWPVAGLLARLQQTVFISRDRADVLDARDGIEQAIASGRRLILFAEGTSSDGSCVLPFKSGFFGLAVDGRLPVQPVTLSLLAADGRPAKDAATRDIYAWHGDMTFPPHFLRFLRSKGARLKVTFHPPRDAAEYSDRKALCSDCHNDVTRGLETLAQAA